MKISTRDLSKELGIHISTLLTYARSHGVIGRSKSVEIVDRNGKTRWQSMQHYTPAQADKLRRLRGKPGKGE